MKLFLLIAASVFFQPLVNEDVLEPSVRNEVDHAISRAPKPAIPVRKPNKAESARPSEGIVPVRIVKTDLFKTNGLSKTEIAIKIVSSQRTDGRWMQGTNDVTFAALEILKSL